jgi:hypothetical protein
VRVRCLASRLTLSTGMQEVKRELLRAAADQRAALAKAKNGAGAVVHRACWGLSALQRSTRTLVGRTRRSRVWWAQARPHVKAHRLTRRKTLRKPRARNDLDRCIYCGKCLHGIARRKVARERVGYENERRAGAAVMCARAPGTGFLLPRTHNMAHIFSASQPHHHGRPA